MTTRVNLRELESIANVLVWIFKVVGSMNSVVGNIKLLSVLEQLPVKREQIAVVVFSPFSPKLQKKTEGSEDGIMDRMLFTW